MFLMGKYAGKVGFIVVGLAVLFTATCGGSGSEVADGGGTDSGSALTVSLSPLEGEVQTAYTGSLKAEGGTAPYTWTLVAGALPSGLRLDSSKGVIEGTPVEAGEYDFTLQVRDSGQPSPITATRDLTLTITSQVHVATTDFYRGFVGQPYAATLSAWGGVPPYTWSVTSGTLPPGLSLDASSGKVSGTPAQGSQVSLTIQVRDSLKPASAVGTKTFTLSISDLRLDQYGGLLDAPVPGGPTGFFRVAKVGNRWTLVSPEGNAFFLLGVYNISGETRADDMGGRYDDRVVAKYGDRDVTWGPQQVRRIKSWGFNSSGPYSIRWVLPTARYSQWPGDHEQPEKIPTIRILNPSLYSLRNSNNLASGPVKDLLHGVGSYYTGYRRSFPDIYDPKFEEFVEAQIVDALSQDESPDSPWTMGWMSDDTDYLNGFGAGPDFQTANPGNNNRHLGWIALITSPSQSNNPEQGVTYADTRVYTKYALADFLRNRYQTIEALNSAWGSAYTTFDSNGGWGSGDGLLDEDGRHTAWVGTDGVFLSNASAGLKRDLDDFLFELASTYFRICNSHIKAHMPHALYFGPTNIGSWGAPAYRQVLQAAGQYVDVLSTSLIVADQQRLDFVAQYLGDKPIAYWEGRIANSDSALWRYPCSSCSANQPDRARFYQARADAYFAATTTASGTRPSVGFIWWEFHDNYGEKANWGLVTLSDNAYDGKEATVSVGRPGVVGSARCRDAWGFPCGSEERDYGDFLSVVRDTNFRILRNLIDALAAQ